MRSLKSIQIRKHVMTTSLEGKKNMDRTGGKHGWVSHRNQLLTGSRSAGWEASLTSPGQTGFGVVCVGFCYTCLNFVLSISSHSGAGIYPLLQCSFHHSVCLTLYEIFHGKTESSKIVFQTKS